MPKTGEIKLKTGQNMSVQQLNAELERQKETKIDRIVKTDKLWVAPDNNLSDLVMNVPEVGEVGITETTHKQIANKLSIPQKYYDKMRNEDQIELLSENINAWFKKDETKRLVRMLDGNARAFLSSRYRRMDNADLLFAALGQFQDNDAQIDSCYLTESYMYLRATVPYLEDEIRQGDKVIAGINISNSEIGAGMLKVEPLVIRLVCTNGLIGHDPIKKVHLGKNNDLEGLLSDETIELENEALWSKVKDYINNTFDKNIFEQWVNNMKNATDVEIEKPVKAIDNIIATYKLPKASKESLLEHFSTENDKTQYGLINSLTRHAQEFNIDERIRLERVAGDLMSLDGAHFKRALIHSVEEPIPT